MRHKYYGFSETGDKRDINQDAFLMRSDGETGLFCVADGMGGHSHGEVASSTIIECLKQWWDTYDDKDYNGDLGRIITSLMQSVKQANTLIREKTAEGAICGSTLEILIIYRDYYGIISAGDSRVYMRHRRRVSQITTDETWENMSDNMLDYRDKQKSRKFGKLVNAVGISDEVRLNTRTDSVNSKDAFFLCSDGIYKYCSDRILKKYIKKADEKSIERCTDRIKEEVYANGAGDNLTAIMVDIQ